MTELYTQDTRCVSHSIRKWHLSLLLMVSNNAEEELNGREAAKQRNQRLKPHMTEINTSTDIPNLGLSCKGSLVFR